MAHTGRAAVLTSIKTVRVFYDRPEAAVAKSMLEAHGIFAVLPDWFLTTNAWHYTFAIQGIRLCVLDDDEPLAAELLKASPNYEESESKASVKNGLIAFLCFYFCGIPYPVRRPTRPS